MHVAVGTFGVQVSLWTQRQQLLSLRRSFWWLIQQVGNVGPTAHVQALGDPLQAHGRFLTKPACQQDLRPVPLAGCPQFILISAQPFDFFLHHPLGFLQASFLTLRAIVRP